jgi:hypothetical protein
MFLRSPQSPAASMRLTPDGRIIGPSYRKCKTSPQILRIAAGAGLARDFAQVLSEAIFDIPGLWKPCAISALIPSWAADRPSEAMHHF